jgi:hypothetical protein
LMFVDQLGESAAASVAEPHQVDGLLVSW